jgi:hypothetical protein
LSTGGKADAVNLKNNIKWHMGFALDGYIGYPTMSIPAKINRLSTIISMIQAVFQTYFTSSSRKGVEYLRFKNAILRLEIKRQLLRKMYLPVYESNPYYYVKRANFEMAIDDLQDDIFNLVNQYGLTGGYSVTNMVSNLGKKPVGVLPAKESGTSDENV